MGLTIVIIKQTFLPFVLAAALTSLPQMAMAQQDQAPAGQAQGFGPRKGAKPGEQGPKAETIATHGSWDVQCSDGPKNEETGQPAGRACGMIQTVKSEKNEKVGLSVIISNVKKGEGSIVVMRILAPTGVYLPTGIPIEIDGAALPNRLQFTRCAPRLCEAFGEASPESLTKFLKGNEATMYLYDAPGNGYPLKLSLAGFSAALEELKKQ